MKLMTERKKFQKKSACLQLSKSFGQTLIVENTPSFLFEDLQHKTKVLSLVKKDDTLPL